MEKIINQNVFADWVIPTSEGPGRGMTWIIHGVEKEKWGVSGTKIKPEHFLYRRCLIWVGVKHWTGELNKCREITVFQAICCLTLALIRFFSFLISFCLSSVSNTHFRLRNMSESLCHRWGFSSLILVEENLLLAFNGSLNSYKEI